MKKWGFLKTVMRPIHDMCGYRVRRWIRNTSGCAVLDGMRNEHIRWSLGVTEKRKNRLDKPKNLTLDMRAYVSSWKFCPLEQNNYEQFLYIIKYEHYKLVVENLLNNIKSLSVKTVFSNLNKAFRIFVEDSRSLQ